MRNARAYLQKGAVIFIVLAVLGYTAHEAKSIIRGATLSIDAPRHGATVDRSLVTVAGSAAHATAITLNGRAIITDEQGVFREHLLLAPGYNIVTVLARDRFGRIAREKIEIIYTPKEGATTTASSHFPPESFPDSPESI